MAAKWFATNEIYQTFFYIHAGENAGIRYWKIKYTSIYKLRMSKNFQVFRLNYVVQNFPDKVTLAANGLAPYI